jgi:hypothetical protein
MRRKEKEDESMIADPQFQTTTLHPSNLDRCNLCGVPRSTHGADWT